ncbi:MAG: hypothetical protein HDT23_04510 [Ruminococcus sp.]|nr:hypothetical protein [Ruminococcus sp.]
MKKIRNILFCLICSFIMMFGCGCFAKVVDGIPPENNVEGFKYKGRRYTYTGLYIADMDRKYMGVEGNLHSDVYFVGNEDNPDIVIVEGVDNTSIYKADDYDIKTDGTITKVLIDPVFRGDNDIVLYKDKDIDMINKLISVDGTVKTYGADNFYTEGNVLYFQYDGCPASDPQIECGYIAKVNNKWVYVNPENQESMKTTRDNNSTEFYGVEIEDPELIIWIEESDISKWIK